MNYQDIFVEHMIKRRKGTKDYLCYGGIILGFIALMWASVLLFFLSGIPSLPFLLIVGSVVGAYYLITMRNVEFEYAITNGDMTVDKIINCRSRKRLTSFDCGDIETLGDYDIDADSLKNKRFDKIVNASDYEDGRGAAYLITKSKKTGYTLLLYSPSEKISDAMKPFLSRELKMELRRKERENKN